MPYPVKGFLEMNEGMVQISLMLEYFSHSLSLKFCSVKFLLALNQACSLAINCITNLNSLLKSCWIGKINTLNTCNFFFPELCDLLGHFNRFCCCCCYTYQYDLSLNYNPYRCRIKITSVACKLQRLVRVWTTKFSSAHRNT